MSTGECYPLFQKAKVDTQDLEALAFEKGKLYLKSFVAHNSQIGLIWFVYPKPYRYVWKYPLSIDFPYWHGVVDPVSHCGKTLLSRSAFSHVEEYDFSTLLDRRRCQRIKFLFQILVSLIRILETCFFWEYDQASNSRISRKVKDGYLTIGRNAQLFYK